MKRFLLTVTLALTIFCGRAQGVLPQTLFNDSHDVGSLHRWGPYSKKYAGLSHIADLSSGLMVDFAIIPGYYRRNYMVPNVLYESGYHPWRCNPEMTEITYRYEMEWKDRVYVDVTYHLVDENRVLVEMECVNNTSTPQNLLLQNVASLAAAAEYPTVALCGADGVEVCYGCDYTLFEPSVKKYNYALVYDGWRRGEKRDSKSLSGSVLANFGENEGDRVVYQFEKSKNPRNIALRYKAPKGATCRVKIAGREIDLVGDGGYKMALIDVSPRKGVVTIESLTKTPFTIDAVLVGENDALARVKVQPKPLRYRPSVDKHDNYFVAKYDDVDNYYGVAWNFKDSEIREFANGELDVFMRRAVHRHPPKYFNGDMRGHYVSAFQRPIVLHPNSKRTIYNLMATGEKQYVESALREFNTNEATVVAEVLTSNDSTTSEDCFLPEATSYALGEQLLEATILTNVVYPVYTEGGYIRHFTPGKNWDSLYTWDLGCISWALTHICPTKAFETIRAYTTSEDSQSSFIHHGTPLPMQFFAWAELNNTLHDVKAEEFMYDRLKRYYDFMVGHHPYSTTRMPSGLIRTWDYFYSTGGWDDYPPQHALRSNTHLYPLVAPMVSSSYYLRAAKILRMSAEKLGKTDDVKHYTKDIEMLTKAIQTHAWDEESGYFTYVMHNDAGEVVGLYEAPDGSNFNKGLDGVSPLVAGICTPEQTARLVGHIFSPKELWTDVGISTVDQSASYYDHAGYWNGSVWIPHQMMLWKSMLDNNLTDRAHQIAFTALETWSTECNASYNSPEHFIISSGRGAGWHNFSGLSSPVVCWYHSYFREGTITPGFDVAIEKTQWKNDNSECCATLRFERDAVGRSLAIVVCLNPDHSYRATLDGKELQVKSPYRGLLYVSLEANAEPATLVIERM